MSNETQDEATKCASHRHFGTVLGDKWCQLPEDHEGPCESTNVRWDKNMVAAYCSIMGPGAARPLCQLSTGHPGLHNANGFEWSGEGNPAEFCPSCFGKIPSGCICASTKHNDDISYAQYLHDYAKQVAIRPKRCHYQLPCTLPRNHEGNCFHIQQSEHAKEEQCRSGALCSLLEGHVGECCFTPPMPLVHQKQADPINPHYCKQGNIECIDAIEAALSREEFIGFLRGQVIKYTWRCRQKGGIEDLEKSQWYTRRLIEFLKKNASS